MKPLLDELREALEPFAAQATTPGPEYCGHLGCNRKAGHRGDHIPTFQGRARAALQRAKNEREGNVVAVTGADKMTFVGGHIDTVTVGHDERPPERDALKAELAEARGAVKRLLADIHEKKAELASLRAVIEEENP